MTSDPRIERAYAGYQKLEQLAHLAGGSPFVGGSGPLRSPVLIIGEAPGPQEIKAGRPFVGPSGERLNEWLGDVGIERRMCRVTNAVKYLPRDSSGDLRKPFYPEISASLPCLLVEIAVTSPLFILTLGATALKALSPQRTLTEVHGRRFAALLGATRHLVLPLYHPSYCLRSDEADAAARQALALWGASLDRPAPAASA